MQRPVSTSAPHASTCSASAVSSRVLPTPASPESSTAPASPRSARAKAARSRRISWVRATSGIPEPSRGTRSILAHTPDSFRPLIAMTTITRPLPGGLADARGLPRGLPALLRRYLDVGPRGPQVADGAAGTGGPDAAPGLVQFLGPVGRFGPDRVQQQIAVHRV